ncbi:DMT family transporter [Planotetraspora phitsanulokensis]|uniref:DMT family transporter n=1 Tax=Planotetraspora phitsanulokensis TaxID=575192 RepID=UPI001EF3D1E8|nr:DMT family transporter [Planotetraspora phitsanulokensis]
MILAVCAAACNALSSVLQRRAARTAPQSEAFKLSLLWDMMRRPVWLGGIGAMIGGFLFQASALNFGMLSLVQPLLIMELPFTMLIIWLMFGIKLNRQLWLAIISVTLGLALLLASASPGGGHQAPTAQDWVITAIVCGGIAAFLIGMAKIKSGSRRAALLGIASGLGFAVTAALMKESTRLFATEKAAVLTTWPVYAMVAAGIFSVFVLQTALQSGNLVVVQPTLNVTDPVTSIGLGVALFGESIRLGAWVVLELLGVGLIFYGSVKLAQSPHIRGQDLMAPKEE